MATTTAPLGTNINQLATAIGGDVKGLKSSVSTKLSTLQTSIDSEQTQITSLSTSIVAVKALIRAGRYRQNSVGIYSAPTTITHNLGAYIADPYSINILMRDSITHEITTADYTNYTSNSVDISSPVAATVDVFITT